MTPLSGLGGGTVTRLSDNTSLPLGEAIESGWVTVEGLSSASALELTSVDGEAYRLDVEDAVVMSEQTEEFREDIIDTVEWVSGMGENPDLWTEDVWEHKSNAARAVLGNDLKFARAFTSASENASLSAMWELRLKVNAAHGEMIAYAHLNSGEDAFDRIVMSAGQPVERFTGPDADYKIMKKFRADGSRLNVHVTDPYGLEQLEGILKHARAEFEKARKKGRQAQNAQERTAALNRQKYLREHAAQVGLAALATALALAGNTVSADGDVLTISNDSELIANAGGGGNMLFDNGTLFAFGDAEPPEGPRDRWSKIVPRPILALMKRDDEVRRIARTPQGHNWWTTMVRGPSKAVQRIDSVMSSAISAVLRAVHRNAAPEETVKEVEEAIEFNRKSHEAFPPLGEIEVNLYLDDDERLFVRVVLYQTPRGVQFALVVK